MSAELIQRLRCMAYVICTEAADALAALTRERDRLQGIARDAAEAATEHQREVLRLRAELDALKRQEPVAWAHGGFEWHPSYRAQSEQVVKLTRAAQLQYGFTMPLYAAPTPAAAKPQETGAHTREAICAALLVGLPLSAEQRASLLVMLRTAGDAEALRAPTVEAAERMGQVGSKAAGVPHNDAERMAFEAWMRGHCWAMCATWNGSSYASDAERDSICSYVDPHAMRTRQLWAAWRDRAALAADAGRAKTEGGES